MRLSTADLEHVLGHAGDAFEELRGARILLTGGTGFFGRWLTETLLFAVDQRSLDLTLVLLTRRPEQFSAESPHLATHPAVQLIRGDVRSFDYAGPLTHVVHAATESGTSLNWDLPAEMYDVIVAGTGRVLTVAVKSGAKRLLYVSSGAVYGYQVPQVTHMREEYRGAPDSLDYAAAYGNGKRAAEWMCAAATAQNAVQCTVARPFAFVGPHLPIDAHFAAGNFIRDGLAGGTIKVNGDGTTVRSYMYAADLAAWLWTILVKGRVGRAYNVGSPEAVTIRQLAELVGKQTGARVEIAKKAVPGAVASQYVPDVDRALEELGLSNWTPLEVALSKTLAWHRVAK